MNSGYDRRNALSIAAEQGNEQSVRMQLNDSADPNMQDAHDGRSLLSRAAENGHQGIVKALLEFDANVNAVDGSSRSASSAIPVPGETVSSVLLDKVADHVLLQTMDGGLRYSTPQRKDTKLSCRFSWTTVPE